MSEEKEDYESQKVFLFDCDFHEMKICPNCNKLTPVKMTQNNFFPNFCRICNYVDKISKFKILKQNQELSYEKLKEYLDKIKKE